MDKEEWIRRCAARYEERAGLHCLQACDIAEACLENLDGDLTENPEDAADEDLSYWHD